MSYVIFLVVGLVLGAVVEWIAHPAPNPDGSRRKRSKAKVIGWTAGVFVLLLAVLGVGGWLWANSVFNKIARVDAGPALRHGGGSGTNYLLVGTDNRPGVSGNRTDSMIVLRLQGGTAKMMSIPRDLWVTRADNGQKGKLNGAYNGGPQALIKTITEQIGIPIDRYMEINYVQFAGLVDSIGGITINFLYPAIDRGSGLVVPNAGAVKLNGAQALAFVRSRHYINIINGQEVPDNRNDFGRQMRQQTFLRTVLAKLAGSKNPFKLMKAATEVSHGLKIDNEMRLTDAIHLAWGMAGKNPETITLPTQDAGISSTSALALQQPGAQQAIAQFQN